MAVAHRSVPSLHPMEVEYVGVERRIIDCLVAAVGHAGHLLKGFSSPGDRGAGQCGVPREKRARSQESSEHSNSAGATYPGAEYRRIRMLNTSMYSNARLRRLDRRVVLVMDHLLLRAREQRLHRRVVAAVPPAAHAARDAPLGQGPQRPLADAEMPLKEICGLRVGDERIRRAVPRPPRHARLLPRRRTLGGGPDPVRQRDSRNADLVPSGPESPAGRRLVRHPGAHRPNAVQSGERRGPDGHRQTGSLLGEPLRPAELPPPLGLRRADRQRTHRGGVQAADRKADETNRRPLDGRERQPHGRTLLPHRLRPMGRILARRMTARIRWRTPGPLRLAGGRRTCVNRASPRRACHGHRTI